jgi:hypothetical protein
MENEYVIKIVDVGYKTSLDIFIFKPLITGNILVLRGDEEEIVPMGTKPKPTLSLTKIQLQALSDAINSIGISPKQGFIEGKLEATEKHLEDTRKLLKLN